MQKLDILQGKQESNDYPYGSMKCYITFDVEFKPKKGYRYVTQTTNPKTGCVNKPKKGTYTSFMCLQREKNGHVSPFSLWINGYEDIARMIEFLTLHDITFTEEESQFLWAEVITCIRGNARYTKLAEGVEISEFLDTTRAAQMIEKFKNYANFNEIKDIGFDLDALNALKE